MSAVVMGSFRWWVEAAQEAGPAGHASTMSFNTFADPRLLSQVPPA